MCSNSLAPTVFTHSILTHHHADIHIILRYRCILIPFPLMPADRRMLVLTLSCHAKTPELAICELGINAPFDRELKALNLLHFVHHFSHSGSDVDPSPAAVWLFKRSRLRSSGQMLQHLVLPVGLLLCFSHVLRGNGPGPHVSCILHVART